MPTQLPVTKSLVLAAQVCPTAAWYQAHDEDDGEERTEADQLRMLEGTEVGQRARNLYPDGALVGSRKMTEAVMETKKFLADPKVTVVFEAAFDLGGIVARADILVRDGGGWRLYEVKSSLNDSGELVADLAYTVMVASRAGVKLTRASLLLLSRAYRLGQPDTDLFVEADHTADVLPLAGPMSSVAATLLTVLNSATPPKPGLIRACRDCPYFREQCLGKGVEHHMLTLPRLLEDRFQALNATGITRIADIPATVKLSESQKVVREAVLAGKPLWDRTALSTLLNKVRWPAGYLDFETFKTAIPVYPDIGPHEQVVTQYSLHVCDSPGKERSHHEYLADARQDSRRELAERLLGDLEAAKSIVVYSGFEKRVLTELQGLFPDLDGGLQTCIDRLFDLEAALKPGVYYHPAFGGRSSIKVTFPVLVPTMSYDDLAVGDGDTAIAMFAKMARGEITGADAKRVRQELLDYCKRDTLAMVELHRALTVLLG